MKMKAVRYKDIEQYPAYFKLQRKVKESFFGSAPAPFIGHYGYPSVNVGILAPQEVEKDAWLHDAPRHWATQSFGIDRIVDLRMSLVNSRAVAHIKKPEKITSMAQAVGLASRPVDMEIDLTKKPHLRKLGDHIVMPMGPTGQIKKARITENVKINQRVQKVHYDTDLKAADAVKYLYKHDIEENVLSRIFSVGTVGIGKNRKLVPTRWSLTSVDSTLGNHFVKEIKEYNSIDYSVYFGGYLGNYYLFLCFPDVWSYELFELYLPNALGQRKDAVRYSTDFEPYWGMKGYAEQCAGGFYSVRLAIAEKLAALRRQGSVLALRFVTDEYSVPLGVWLTREAARKSLASTPQTFASRELMLRYVDGFVRNKFGFDVQILLDASKLLQIEKHQKRLIEFL